MKNSIRYFTAALGLAAAAWPAARAADDKPAATKEEKKELRVIAAPERGRHVIGVSGDKREKVEKETVTFLGVETSPVPAALSAQLALAKGTGLVVNHVAPKSPAASVLQEHDILLKLDDQILIEARQLAVLIRNHKEGDEVTLTYLRGGQKTTASVKLGQHEVPKMTLFERVGPGAMGFGFGSDRDGKFDLGVPRGDALEGRAEWDRVLSLLQRAQAAPDGPRGSVPPPARIRIEHGDGPGLRAMSINTGNSNIVFSDDDGSLELTMKDGTKTLVAKDAKGAELYSGPVTTPAERKALPESVRARLEKLEGMHNITFRTDGDFKGAEMKYVRPRGIVMPLPDRASRVPASLSAFY